MAQQRTKKSAKKFRVWFCKYLKLHSHILPCAECRKHFTALLKNEDVQDLFARVENSSLDGGDDGLCEELVYRIHNMVNKNLNKRELLFGEIPNFGPHEFTLNAMGFFNAIFLNAVENDSVSVQRLYEACMLFHCLTQSFESEDRNIEELSNAVYMVATEIGEGQTVLKMNQLKRFMKYIQNTLSSPFSDYASELSRVYNRYC